MKEIINKKKYRITTNTACNSEDVGLAAAYNALRYYDNDEGLLITNNETGEVLFRYEKGAVQWIDGDFARRLFDV